MNIPGVVDTIFPGLGSGISSMLRGGGPSMPDSGAAAREEEARKAALRARIDKFYGIGPQVPVMGEPPPPSRSALAASLRRTGEGPAQPDSVITGYQDDPEVAAAKSQMEGENTKLSDATRSYYTDELARQYAKAERDTRFSLARRGLLGGSAGVDTQAELSTDRNLGATRVDEAVRRAVASLTSQRESERLNAINLVNSGAGDSAVTAAQRGLTNAFENVNTQQKANLFGDLFGTAADATAASNLTSQQAALAARYRDQLATFFPVRTTTSGRVTPSGGG